MTDNKPRAPRRDLLKALGLGAFTAAALPTRWTKPVVESVLLPAHAQTSADVPGTTPGCPAVSIPGRQLLCPSLGDSETATRFVFSLENGCLVFETQSVTFDPLATIPDNELFIVETTTAVTVQLTLAFAGGGGVEATATCSSAVAVTSFPYTDTISAGGQDFQVSTQVSQFDSPDAGVSFTDLVFTPV